MSEKSKRKVNPRRRLLLRLMLGIGIFAALMSAAIYALQPKGAQIVFIAPDDNDIDQIWIADLYDPENPQQLTDFQQGRTIWPFQAASERGILLLVKSDTIGKLISVWTYQTQSNELSHVFDCDDYCSGWVLHPSGRWFAYQEDTSSDNINIYIYDLQEAQKILVDTVYDGYPHVYYEPHPQWLGNEDVLIYRTVGGFNTNEFEFFSVEDNRIIEHFNVEVSYFTPIFSPDALHYAYSPIHPHVFPQSLSISSIDEVDDTVFTVQSEDESGTLRATYILDWHPNNQLLVSREDWYISDCSCFSYYLNLYNPNTGEREILANNRNSILYQNASFSQNGMQLLYGVHDRESHISQIMIFDMESGEEIALPLFGHSPQWVNGGRS